MEKQQIIHKVEKFASDQSSKPHQPTIGVFAPRFISSYITKVLMFVVNELPIIPVAQSSPKHLVVSLKR